MVSVATPRVEAWRAGYKPITYYFYQAGALKNLTGWTFKLRGKTVAAGEDGAETFDIAHSTLSDLPNGKVVFELGTTQLATAGQYIVGAEYTDTLTHTSHFHKFILEVVIHVKDMT